MGCSRNNQLGSPFLEEPEFPLSSWDKKWLALAEFVAGFSKDPSTKVGAVVQGEFPNQIAFGWNGVPPGIADDERLLDREWKYARVVHGEMNALANCAFLPRTLYVTQPCCHRCAVHILSYRSLTRVVASYTDEFMSRWGDSVQTTKDIFAEAGRVQFEIHKK